MRVTLKQIAQKAGVSSSLVSMLLNGDARARISAQKKAHVLELIKTSGYKPSAMARGLRTKRSRMIGMVTGGITKKYFAEFAEACMKFCDMRGYQLLLAVSSWDKSKEEQCLENLLNYQVDGILYIPQASDDFLRKLRMRVETVPICLRQQKFPGYSSVCYDETRAVADAICLHGQNGYWLILDFQDSYLARFGKLAGKKIAAPQRIYDREKIALEDIVSDLIRTRPPFFYCRDNSFTRQVLEALHLAAPDYRPNVVTSYTFEQDLIPCQEVVGYIFNDFFRFVRETVNHLLDVVENGAAATAVRDIEITNCYYPLEQFLAFKKYSPDTFEKAHAQFMELEKTR